MDNFDELNDNFDYDIHKLSSERNRRLNRYRNRNLKEPEIIIVDLNFHLTNTFWGNSWSCDEKLKLVKGRGTKTTINVQNSHSFPEVWDCRVIYYINADNHNIYLKSLDGHVNIQIYNNVFTCSGIESHEIEGFVNEDVVMHKS